MLKSVKERGKKERKEEKNEDEDNYEEKGITDYPFLKKKNRVLIH